MLPLAAALGSMSGCIAYIDDPKDGDEPGSGGKQDVVGSTDDTGPGTDDGSSLQPSCDAEHLVSIERPFGPGDDRRFTYSFQWLDRAGSDATTVIVLPGGPGGTSIGSMEAIPADYDLVLTDPRGIGCNASQGEPFPPESYGTERFAEDILAIVEELALEDYVLYGHSYGTALATVTASMAEAKGLPRPRLVVLEGIMGNAVEDDSAAYLALWQSVLAALPADVRAALTAAEPPLGLSRGTWGEFIAVVLSQFGPEPLFNMLQQLQEGGDVQQLEATVAQLGGLPPDWKLPDRVRLFQPVACRELAEESWFDYTLVEGELVPHVDLCADIDVDRPYAPADWQIGVPIVYVQGTADPATPMAGARAHFEAQTGSDRHFVAVEGAAHLPLKWALAQSCGDLLWRAMLEESSPHAPSGLRSALEEVVPQCGWPTTVESAAKGE